MKEIRVATDPAYGILIGTDLRKQVGELFGTLLGHKAKIAVIADETVDRLWGDEVSDALAKAGHTPVRFPFPGGEENKTLATVNGLLGRMTEAEITRSDAVLALGGGITGDVAGLCASLYLRGIPCVQMPTTLLAMLDSSVGGKTGVNLDGSKNRIGTFTQPALVAVDPAFLSTLPRENYAEGIAEAIKYAVSFDPTLFDLLYTDFDPVTLIYRCLSIKADIVAADPKEEGVRRLLNFGHTAGHAIEEMTDHEFSHGEAVAVGMVIATRYALKIGYCRRDFLSDLIGLLSYYGLPNAVIATEEELLAAIRKDKKREGQTLHLILPKKLGEVGVFDVDIDRLSGFLPG